MRRFAAGMRYRSDIDGLRAVAVLSVVLFHLELPRGFSGGFVGVDVFFVISGYLITGILQEGATEGRLRIADFYDRRVRRIFPALFLVHVFCLLASSALQFASEAADTGRDVLASLAFVSNVVFCRAAGYFDQTSKTSLLLHTWSLSVEEQFYVVFPLLLFVLGRTSRRTRLFALAALGVGSFAAAAWMVRLEAPRAFYLMPYRAWELLLGALVSQGAFPSVKRQWVSELLGTLGIALVLASVFAIDGSTPFPGPWALPPCVGAALMIHSGLEGTTMIGRMLGAAPLRFVGLISYSLYLWHWPLIVLFHARAGALTALHRAEIAALSLVLSTLSYRYVELPFRRKPHRLGARATLSRAALGMAGVAALAVGIPRAAARLSPESSAEAVLAYLKYPAAKVVRSGSCFMTTGYDAPELFQKDVCMALRGDRKNVLVLGDSHAAHLWSGLRDARPDINFLQATASGCGAFVHQSGAKRCTRLFAYVFHEFLPNHRVDAIVYHGRWTLHYLKDIQSTVEYLRQFTDRVLMIGPPVEYDQPLPRLLSQSILAGDAALPERHLVHRIRETDRALALVMAKSGAEYHSLYDAACPNGKCTTWASPGVPLEYDYGHLTAAGSKLLAERISRELFP